MRRIEKTLDIPVPACDAQERWGEFQRTRAEVAAIAEVRFEDLAADRTRLTIAGDSASVEGTAEEFRQFVEKTCRGRAGSSGSARHRAGTESI